MPFMCMNIIEPRRFIHTFRMLSLIVEQGVDGSGAILREVFFFYDGFLFPSRLLLRLFIFCLIYLHSDVNARRVRIFVL